ncbi:hypothetical protein MXD62_33535 [Frankia sp. Mgl5]|uniref:hypothetical protein n=1 Tax=Frankia sp. Mgl5 TaxID=2933793 RepID=UPI00200BDA12|nr:hypothetical protein [Frankia sp. Mgl5]MCK9932004.1 hypothetical protein [Frankia sp. Mgl5]
MPIDTAYLAMNSFCDFVESSCSPLDARAVNLNLLQDYLALWVEEGGAVATTKGNFDTYLVTVALIAGEYQRYRYHGDSEVGRAIGSLMIHGLFDVDAPGIRCLERDFYELRKPRQAKHGEAEA